jgi:hypothetical protein
VTSSLNPDSLPCLGTGLSTDLYFPPLDDLLNTLAKNALQPDFVEVFRGRTVDLKHAREHIVPPAIPMTYHGDALWYTDPAFEHHPAYRHETCRANRHLDVTGSPWMIHECARKAVSGRTFGYYVPPVLEPSVARIIRQNGLLLSSRLEGRTLLIEIPPFPFFSMGQLPCGEFFRQILEQTPLGMGLDIGHALTAFCLEQPIFSPARFADWIRNTFPLEHIVEIHVGGLLSLQGTSHPALWDDHRAPVPSVLWESFDAVLATCPLPSLKAVALEVDNKEIPSIVSEFRTFREIVRRSWSPHRERRNPLPEDDKTGQVISSRKDLSPERQPADVSAVESLDLLLLETLLDGKSPAPEWTRGDPALYRERIYTDEIWEFGGHLPDLFPRTIHLVSRFIADPRTDFVSFFHRVAWTDRDPYDYLRAKTIATRMWVEHLVQEKFIHGEAAKHVLQTVREEAEQILFDQDTVNGDPCPRADNPGGCSSCDRPFTGTSLSANPSSSLPDGGL